MRGKRELAALCEQGLAHLQAARWQNAEASFQAVLAADTGVRDRVQGVSAYGLATLAHDRQRPEDALVHARRARERAPDLIDAYLLPAHVLCGLGRTAEAIPLCRAALRRAPGHENASLALGKALHQAGDLAAAEACYTELAGRHPDLPDAQARLGALLFETERYPAAIEAFDAALRLRPDDMRTRHDRALALLEFGGLTEAHDELQRVVAVCPDWADAHNGLGCALRGLGRLDEAESALTTALQLAPSLAMARCNLATTLLQAGRLAEGWPLLESRWRMPDMVARNFDCPQWDGAAVPGKTVLLHGEQGMGDTLQFCRFVAAAAAASQARVVFEVPGPLRHLMRSLDAPAELAAPGTTSGFDLHCPLMSLPYALGNQGFESLPPAPYLAAAPAEAAAWRERLAHLPGRRVGLVWSGNPRFAGMRARRDIPAARLAPLGALRGVSFVSVQKDASDADLATLGGFFPLHDPTAGLGDYADTAALVEALDLVIGVDTSVVHLAGALGRPTWLLNRFDTCWRWHRGRSDSPWYPSVRIFRQPSAGDWSAVIAEIFESLKS